MPNETQNELTTLKAEIDALEKEAKKHEQLARDCHTKRSEKKQELSKILAQINDAKVVHAVESSLSTVNQCRDDMENLKNQLKDELASIVSLKKELEEKKSEQGE